MSTTTMTDMNSQSPEPKKKSKIPLIFFAFFAVVLAANSTMIYIALSSWTGLETRNSYLKGRDYNQTLESLRAQDALGWTVESALADRAAPGEFLVTVRVTGTAGDAVAVDRVSVRLERPTHHGIDQEITLERAGPGVFAGPVTLDHAGNWDIRRLIWRGEETHQSIERVFVAPERVGLEGAE